MLQLEVMRLFDEVVHQAFDTFICEHGYNADQTRFLRTVQTVFMQRRKLALDDSTKRMVYTPNELRRCAGLGLAQ